MSKREPSRLSCAEVLGQLYSYLDGEVDHMTESDIEHHLHHCRECFSRVDFEKKLRRKLRQSASVETPEEVQARMRNIMSKF